MKKETPFQKQCREYMEGETAYLGIRKNEHGHVTAVPKPGILSRLLSLATR